MLTDRLLVATLDLLAETGWKSLTIDRAATRATADPIAAHRLYGDVESLAIDALGACRLVQLPAASGTLRGDLVALLRPWQRPPTRDERAATALLGQIGRRPVLLAALHATLRASLEQVAHELCHRPPAPAGMVPNQATIVLDRMLRLLWLDHLTAATDPLTRRQLERLVDSVLHALGLPRVTPTPGGAAA